MSKNIASLLSTVSIVVSILIGVLSIDAAIKNAAVTEEARLVRLEQIVYVQQEKVDSFIAKTEKGNEELTRFLFNLSKDTKCKP